MMLVLPVIVPSCEPMPATGVGSIWAGTSALDPYRWCGSESVGSVSRCMSVNVTVSVSMSVNLNVIVLFKSLVIRARLSLAGWC